MSSSLSLQQANDIIAHALRAARDKQYQPMAVVVLDEAGHLKAAQREDGASMFRIDVATGKAWGSVAMGASSRELHKRATGNPVFFNALSETGKGRFLPQPGAVLILDAEGKMIGAVGASGGTGDEDEEICMQGVQKVGLRVG